MLRRFLRNNGLTLCLLVLFAGSLCGQILAGHRQHDEFLIVHGQRPESLLSYLRGGEFFESTFENWESEFLQMALYVWLTSFLFQKGSAESKDPEKQEDEESRPQQGWRARLYGQSLFVAFMALFLTSFSLHLVGGAREACREAQLHESACPSLLDHAVSSKFWFQSFQNWQSEFLSVATLVVLSIFLRQRGSPESKAMNAPHHATGKG